MFKDYFSEVNSFFKGRAEEHIRLCPLCNTLKVDTFNREFGLIYQCEECHHKWLAMQPTQDVLDEFYERSRAMFTWSKIKSTDIDSKRQCDKFSYFWDFINEVKIDSILDVGCGTGYFLNALPDTIRRAGTEAHKRSADHCKFKVYNPTDVITEKFQAISMFGILEHVKNPKEFINDQSKFLDANGFLFIIVPNCDSAAWAVLGERNCSICPQHLSYFNIDTLVRCLDNCGYLLHRYTTKETEYKAICRTLAGVDPYCKVQIGPHPQLDEQSILKNNQGAKICAIFKRKDKDVPHSNHTSSSRFQVNSQQESSQASCQ